MEQISKTLSMETVHKEKLVIKYDTEDEMLLDAGSKAFEGYSVDEVDGLKVAYSKLVNA